MTRLAIIIVVLSVSYVGYAQTTREPKPENLTGRCDHGYKYFNDSCYYFSCRRCKKNYYDALSFCKKYGGNLVSIHSQQEHDFLMRYSNNFVTGLRYSEDDNKFSWSDNSSLDFKKIASNFGKRCGHFGRCVRVKNHKWNNAGCYRQFRWICHKKPLVLSSACPEQNSEPLFDGGLLTSPGYPTEYLIGPSSCYYNLVVKTDELITIIFNKTDLYFDSQSSNLDHDEIEIYEGFEEDAKLIGRVTSASEPGVSFETEKINEMTVRFRSGPGNNRTGVWLATWFSIPNKRVRYAEAYRKYLAARNKGLSTTLAPIKPTTAATTTTHYTAKKPTNAETKEATNATSPAVSSSSSSTVSSTSTAATPTTSTPATATTTETDVTSKSTSSTTSRPLRTRATRKATTRH